MIHYSTLRINTAYYEASESLRLGPSWSLMNTFVRGDNSGENAKVPRYLVPMKSTSKT
jgi:hypothetical protein